MLLPPFAKRPSAVDLARKISIACLTLAPALHVLAAPGITAPAAGNIAENTVGGTGAGWFFSAANANPIALNGATSTDKFKVKISVAHGQVHLSPVSNPPAGGTSHPGIRPAAGTLFDSSGDPVLDAAQTPPVAITNGPGTGIDVIEFQGTYSDINTVLNGLRYLPHIYYNGSDTLKIEVFNPGYPASFPDVAIVSASVPITVTPVPQAKAISDFKGVVQNQAATGNLLTNDVDSATGITITQVAVVGGATATTFPATLTVGGAGNVVVQSNGAYTFTPTPGYLGTVPEITSTTSATASNTASLWLTMLKDTNGDGTADIATPDTSLALKADTDLNGVITDTEARNALAGFVNFASLTRAGGTYTTDEAGTNIVPVTVHVLETTDPYGGWLQNGFASSGGTPVPASIEFGERTIGPAGPHITFEMAFANKSVARLSSEGINTKEVGTEVVSFTAKGATAGFQWLIPSGYLNRDNDASTNAASQYGILRIDVSTTNVANDTITIYGSSPNHNLGLKVAYDIVTNQAIDGVVVTHKNVVNAGTQQVAALRLAVQPFVANNPPIDPDDTNTAYKNATLTVGAADGVLKNATDADIGDIISVTSFQLPGDPTIYIAGQTATITDVGTLQINADGSYVFAPATDYIGTVPVATYTLTDGKGGMDTSTLTITMADNDPPVDPDDTNTTAQGVPLTVTAANGVLNGATDPDGDPITLTSFTLPGSATVYTAGQTATIAGVGTLTINADGSYVFAPVPSFAGIAPVATYTLTDGKGGTDTSTLTITVPATIPEDTPVPLSGITVQPGGGGTVTTTVTVTNGTATVNTGSGATVTGDGTGTITITGTPAQVNDALKDLTFTNTPDFNGASSVTVSSNNGSPTVTLPVTVTPVVDVTDDARTTPFNTPITIPVLANDSFENPARVISEIDGQPVTVDTPIPVANGTVTVQADNTVIFTPTKDYTGQAVFTYTVTAGGIKETANVTVTINGPVPAPAPVPVGGGLFGGLMVTLMAAWGMRNLRRRKQ